MLNMVAKRQPQYALIMQNRSTTKTGEPPGAVPLRTEHPWPLNIVRGEWHVIKRAPISFLVFFVLGGLSVLFLYSTFVIPGKNGTIENLTAERDRFKSAWESSGASVAPLKGQAIILADQLLEFGNEWKTNSQMNGFVEYGTEFELRVEKMRNDLAQHGQRSRNKQLWSTRPNNPDAILNLSAEIRRLAQGLID